MDIETVLNGRRCKIIGSFAPTMGRGSHIRGEYWDNTKQAIRGQTNTMRNMEIGNNGKIHQNQNIEARSAIWKWANASNRKRKWWGTSKYCNKYQLSAANTHFEPNNQNKRNLITWQGSYDWAQNEWII